MKVRCIRTTVCGDTTLGKIYNVIETHTPLDLTKGNFYYIKDDLDRCGWHSKDFFEVVKEDIMTKKEFDKKYVGEKLAVHCKTEELANEFLAMAHKFGYEWISGSSYLKRNLWTAHKENTCYNIAKGVYGSISFCKTKGFTIVEFNGFDKETSSLQERIDFINEMFTKPAIKLHFDTPHYILGSLRGYNKLFPQVEWVKHDKKKRTTVVKFIGHEKAITSKATKGERYSEYMGVLVCMVKYLTNSTPRELKDYMSEVAQKDVDVMKANAIKSKKEAREKQDKIAKLEKELGELKK